MRYLLLSAFALISYLLPSQAYEKLNGPYGGGSKVHEGNNGVLYQFPENSGILYRSLDGGQSWRSFDLPTNASFYKIEVGRDGNLYFLVFSDLYKSTNQGLSWAKIPLPAGVQATVVNALADATIFIYSDSGIYTSSDNGLNWNQRNLGGSVSQFYASTITGWMYAISSAKIFLSKDKGVNWIEFYSDDFGSDGYCFAEMQNSNLFISGVDFIWRFDTSATLLLKTGVRKSTAMRVDMAFSNSGRLFAAEQHEAYYSDDLGVIWKPLSALAGNINIAHSFSATSDGQVFGVRYSGSLYNSGDNGSLWVFSAYGMPEAIVHELDFISTTKILALTSDGLFYSSDFGQKWTLIAASQHEFRFSSGRNVETSGDEIYFMDGVDLYHFDQPGSLPVKMNHAIFKQGRYFNLLLNQSSGDLFVFDIAQLFRSSDKGLQWTSLQPQGILQMYDFPNGDMLALSENSIFRSTDFGDQWSPVLNFQSAAQQGFGIDGNAFQTAYVLANFTNESVLFISDDNGASWSRSSLADPRGIGWSPVNRIASNNVGNVFIPDLLSERIYKSSADRKSLTAFGDLLSNIAGAYVSPDQRLYVAANGLYRTKVATSSTKVVQGFAYQDLNNNCLLDGGEPVLPNARIRVSNGNDVFVTGSDQSGNFYVPVISGTYNFELTSPSNYWKSCTQTVQTATYNFNSILNLGGQLNKRCPYLEVDVQVSRLRPCFESDIQLHYANYGTADAPDSYLEVELDPDLEFVSSGLPPTSQTGNLFRFDLGNLQKLTNGSFSIRVKLTCDVPLGNIHCIQAHIYPDSFCTAATYAKITTNALCLGDSVKLVIRNQGTAAMTASKKWYVYDQSEVSSVLKLVDSGDFQLDAGQEFTTTITGHERLLFVAEQDDSYPVKLQSKTEIISCLTNPDPGLPPQRITNLDEGDPFLSNICIQNRGSFDPNDITGFPLGLTDRKYIEKEQELEYLIRFQNTGTDTAFTVRIENLIRKDQLDISSFMPGASSHAYQHLITPEGKLIFTFSNIQLPDSNIHEAASHGFVQYRIKPIQKLLKGSKVYNDAVIYFDFNSGVQTNLEFHTVGLPVAVATKDQLGSSDLKMYFTPNPGSDAVQIQLKGQQRGSSFYYLHIYNEWSQKVNETKISELSKPVKLEKLNPGFYYLLLLDDQSELIGSGKFIRN
ncbi:MAG: hypothetical protein IPM34_06370 [Saprospiraceae bacterium]|nr:hypothetical protein [Saprospiraceae bacterium]